LLDLLMNKYSEAIEFIRISDIDGAFIENVRHKLPSDYMPQVNWLNLTPRILNKIK
jgi:hypothetical protein